MNSNETKKQNSPSPEEIIYLDYHATTPCDPRVVEAMLPYFTENFANPSSSHKLGRNADKAINQARQTIADHIGALKGEIIFTSGATESNNLTIQGLAHHAKRNGNKRNKILTSSIEHKSVLNVAAALEEQGFIHEEIPVDSGGLVQLNTLEKMIDEQTLLVSVMAANNEIGTIQPLKKISDITHNYGALFHTDAAQALARIDIDVNKWQVDFISLSAHKGYGPKGVGALYIRGGVTQQPIDTIKFGGGQEKNIRPGTHNLPGIIGFAKTCELAEENFNLEIKRIQGIRDKLERLILDDFPKARVVGNTEYRLPSTTNIHFPGIEAEALIPRLEKKNIIISSGSACDSGAPESSHVLKAVGLSEQEAYECIRLAIGRETSFNINKIKNDILSQLKIIQSILS